MAIKTLLKTFVCTIPPKLVERSPSLTWQTLKADFKEIVAISFAAKILGHTFLLETSRELLKMLVYVANFKFEMKFQVTPTVDKVLNNCHEMVASWQRFLAKIGNKDGERVVPAALDHHRLPKRSSRRYYFPSTRRRFCADIC